MSTKTDTTEEKTETEKEKVANDDYLRLAADFENYRKQSVEERKMAAEFGKTAVVNDVLDAMDAFDAAKGQGEWTEGLEMAVGNLDSLLRKYGAERVEATGKEFDPATMEAVGTADGGVSNTVQSQHRAGWTMHGRVIRPARVIVYK